MAENPEGIQPPAEIVAQIATYLINDHYLHADSTSKALTKYRLVCSSFGWEFGSRVFEQVTAHDFRDERTISIHCGPRNSKSLTQLSQLLDTSPWIATFIRKFHLRVEFDATEPQEFVPSDAALEHMPRVLGALNRLQEFTFEALAWGVTLTFQVVTAPIRSALSSTFQLPTLRTLSISNLSGVPLSIFTAESRVMSLGLSQASFIAYPGSADATPLVKLEIVDIDKSLQESFEELLRANPEPFPALLHLTVSDSFFPIVQKLVLSARSLQTFDFSARERNVISFFRWSDTKSYFGPINFKRNQRLRSVAMRYKSTTFHPRIFREDYSSPVSSTLRSLFDSDIQTVELEMTIRIQRPDIMEYLFALWRWEEINAVFASGRLPRLRRVCIRLCANSPELEIPESLLTEVREILERARVGILPAVTSSGMADVEIVTDFGISLSGGGVGSQ